MTGRSVLFGLPFLVAGIFIECAALNIIHGHKHAPDWVIGVIRSFFFFAGAFLVIHGLRGVVRKAAHDRQAARQPSQPWLADYHWQREGILFSAFNEMVAAIIWNAFLIPFFWIDLNQRGMARLFLVVATAFALLLGLFFWVRWAQELGDLWRYGNSFLAFDSFPYFLGNPLETRLGAPRHPDSVDELTVTLRCMQEKYVTQGTGENRRTQVVCYELYVDLATFKREPWAGAAGYLPISGEPILYPPLGHSAHLLGD